MDILIKSFNRPYYLDRCIKSIYANVLDANLIIKVLDDGTPQKYLDKLQQKFPDIRIEKSEFYANKSKDIEKNTPIEITLIPIKLWLKTVENASNYFVLLEDDIWFTQKINLRKTQHVLQQNNAVIAKLFWLDNPKLIHGQTIKITENLTFYKPNVYTKIPFLYRVIFSMKRFNLPSIMKFFNLYSDDKALQYYSIYGVAGAIFKKEYFLSLWNLHQNKVDENLQLKNAVKFWHKNPMVLFARTKEELVATGFTSSATNKIFNKENFDIFTFNKILNEAWYKDEFDVITDLPNDLNSLSISKILSKENSVKAQVTDWENWVLNFKKQFQEIGCTI